MRPKILLCLLFIILYGCASIEVGGHYISLGMGAEMELPFGWHYVAKHIDAIYITKNGDQHIKIGRYNVLHGSCADGPPEQRLKKLGLTPNMSPEQASKAIFNELNTHVFDLEIIETSIVLLAGQDAFKTLYTYKTPDSMKGEYYGFVKGEWHYHFIYETPSEEFDRYLPDFEKIIKSVRLLPAQTPK